MELFLQQGLFFRCLLLSYLGLNFLNFYIFLPFFSLVLLFLVQHRQLGCIHLLNIQFCQYLCPLLKFCLIWQYGILKLQNVVILKNRKQLSYLAAP